MTVEYAAINEASVSPSPRCRGHQGTESGKNIRVGGRGGASWNAVFWASRGQYTVELTVVLPPAQDCHCPHPVMQWRGLRKPRAFPRIWRWLMVDGEGRDVFFNGVASGKVPMFQ